MTEDGHVECDASVMDGNSGAFGAVGAVPGISIKGVFSVSLVCLYFGAFVLIYVLFFEANDYQV